MRRILFLVMPLVLILAACNREDGSVDISPVPVFTVEGTLDGQQVTMAAGDHGMYMYTFAREESDGTFAYGGRIAKENCETNCGPALEIFLIDTIPFVEQHGESRVWNQINGLLFHGSILNDNVRCEMDLSNNSSSLYGGLSESWQFNDACIVHGKLKQDYLYFPSAGPVKTKLIMHDSAGNTATVQKTLDYFNNEDGGFKLIAESCTAGKALLYVEDPGYNYPSFKWDDDSYGSFKCVNLGTSHEVHTVTVAEGTALETVLSCSVKKGSGTNISFLKADFGFDIIDHDFSKENAWPRVVIRYRDANGKWFDSRNIHQDDYCNYFSLTDVESYQANYQGINTKKAEAFFTASLRDSNMECIKLEHFKVKFGFGSRE